MRKKEKSPTVLQQHMRKIAKKGGRACLKKHGKDHYRKMAEARWAEND